MRKVCAWCGKELNERNDDNINHPVSHGICERCKDYLTSTKVPIRDFINRFDFPILVMDDRGRSQAVNKTASKTLNKKEDEIVGRLGGEIIECKYSFEDEGCGKTEHCSGCDIRNSVMKTMSTSESLKEVTTTQPLKTPSGIRNFKLTFSTEKLEDYVLLKLGKMEQLDEN